MHRLAASPRRFGRRAFVTSALTGIVLAPRTASRVPSQGGPGMATGKTYDVAVIGAGVFGAWTAYQLARRGKRVALLDAYGPSNSRSSSGGESRIIRMGYGSDEIYTRWAMRALPLWKEFFERIREPLFHQTGVLWLAHTTDGYESQCVATLGRLGVPIERLSRADLEKQYPQFDLGPVTWGLLEPQSGVLTARRAVQAVVEEASKSGVEYLNAAVLEPRGSVKLRSVATRGGDSIHAGAFVFACGPWLPKVFPDLLGHRIFPTRQEVFFFGVPPGDPRFEPPALPTWINLGDDEAYGMPDLEHRGLKVAIDRHGPPFDPDWGRRVVTLEGLEEARRYVGHLFPAMKDAPVVESRVCQYENTSNGDFLIDRHPAFENVWLVGGGSGHGFKHGPALGEYVARIIEGGALEPRFARGTREDFEHRAVY